MKHYIAIMALMLSNIVGSKFIQPPEENIRRISEAQREMSLSLDRRLNFFRFDLDSERQSHCQVIPREFGLCYGMEYHRMRLPNLLGHETMKEVVQQTKPWPPLVSKGCHPETRKFLCSLYAPVCMKGYEKSIQPCRSLCEMVRDACAPAMLRFRYPWPNMFNCSKFPDSTTDRLCILPNLNERSHAPKTCPPCRQKKIYTSIRKKFCTFDFVMRVRVKRLEFSEGRTKILINQKSRKILRSAISVSKTKQNTLWMRDGLHCTCNVINNIKHYYLVTGWKDGHSLLLHSITKWNRKYKKLMKKLGKVHCSVLA